MAEIDNIRMGYECEVATLKNLGEEMKKDGISDKVIALLLYQGRKYIGLKYKYKRPKEYRSKIFKRNIEKYGSPYGIYYQDLKKKHNYDYEKIIESSYRTNQNYNKLKKDYEFEKL